MADGWIIDVCKTCGRLATWPFCEHREVKPTGLTRSGWCIDVQVAPADQNGRDLAKANAARRKGSS